MKAVALWWSHYIALHLEGGVLHERTLQDGESPQSALLQLLSSATPKPASVRLIYQPADLQSFPVECPNGSRKTIQQALAPDHPALTTDFAVWACLPLLRTAKGASTNLFIERSPALKRFAESLATNRIKLDGVVPLAAVLEQMPGIPGEAPALAVVHTDSLCCIFTRDDAGNRNVVPISDGNATESRALELFATLSTSFRNQPQMVIVPTISNHWAFESQSSGAPAPTLFPITQLLEEALKLKLTGLNNFLPPSRLPSTATATAIAAAVVIALSAYAIFVHETKQADARAQAAIKAHRKAELSHDLSSRRENSTLIARAATLTADIGQTPAGTAALLNAIDRDLPREVTVTGLRMTNDSFTLDLGIHQGEGAAEGPFFVFFDSISAPSRPWTLTTKRPASATSAITITGSFR